MKPRIARLVIAISAVVLSALAITMTTRSGAAQYRRDLMGRTPEEVIHRLGAPEWDSRRDYPEREDFVFGYSWSWRGVTVHFEHGLVTDVTSADK